MMIIYKTTNLINGKIYVGQDSQNNKDYYGSGFILKKAISKYGKRNFKKETLGICNSKEELDMAEKNWIKKLNSTNRDIGYNISEGGLGVGMVIGDQRRGKKFEEIFGKDKAEKMKIALRNSLKGISWEMRYGKEKADLLKIKQKERCRNKNLERGFSYRTGKKHSEESKRLMRHKHTRYSNPIIVSKNMSASKKGSNHPMFGKHFSIERRINQSIGIKNFFLKNPDKKPVGEKNGMFGKRQSEEAKKLQSEKAKKRKFSKICLKCDSPFITGCLTKYFCDFCFKESTVEERIQLKTKVVANS